MKGLYRGFCRNENGTETIVLNGDKIKGKWKYGSLVNRCHSEGEGIWSPNCELKIKWETVDTYFIFPEFREGCYEVLPETVCEAVRGVTDINGKQIFEGDVIDDNYSTWEVKYNYEHSGFGAYFLDCEQRKIDEEMAKRFEVIGTIFDENLNKA